ncbi:uncharacterized protein LOC119071494 isoform X5 [Bradysia coprophila]|uniref:uncharacterized protein LOC119071494 isoform X5 n=1 Tax=Bradysia coprophila TaxID=38358 RepID=UPI00187D8751|nr:uncharacterized protein LOC119071494 isoform X5 [Bradysia coprophila]
MWVPSGLPFMLGLFLYLSSGLEAQSRRPASRVFTTNIKSSSNSDFNCPEEFGYYPHPTDCSQYYVCVFGGALLESCTGGLMYSHELQTCDWPRNVGCELSDNIAPSAIDRQVTPRIPQIQTIQPQAHTSQPQKFRFSSPSAPSSSGQGIPARVHAIPPPPQLKVAPNPVITSRGQPKFEEEKDLAELYAEAHETLPPVEEEESDRQQRVYRGQPSTVTQVQRDRDGLLHQPSVNAISTHGKIGSFAFGSQIGQHSDRKKAHADRIKRDIETETYTNETLAIQTSSPSTSDEYKRSPRQLRPPPIARSPWQFGNNDQYNNDKQFQPRLTVNQNYNPFLTVPQSTNSSPYFKPREQSNAKPEYNPYANSYSKANNAGGEQAKTSQFHSNPSYRYVDQDNFYANNFKASTKDPLYPDTQNTPIYSNNAKPKFKPAHDDRLPDNFSFFHFGNDNRDEREHRKIISPQEFVNKLPNVAILPNATPKNQFISFSTVGGFYNNQPTTQSPIDDYKEFSKFRQSNANGKLSFSTPRPNVYHSSPAPVYESTDDYYDYGKGSYVGSFYSTTPPPHQQYSTPPRIFYQPVTTTQRSNFYNKAITKHQELPTTYSPQYEYPTTQKPQHRQHSNIQTTTPRVAPDITSHTYYPVNVAFQQIDTKEHHKSPAIFNYHVVKDEITKPTQKTQRFFVTKKSTAESTTTSPPPTTQKHSTIKLGDDFTGPLVGLDFDFDKFVAGIRETHLSQLDAKIANHYKDKALNTTPKKTYVDVSRATTTARSIPDSSTWKPVETTTVTFGSRVERTTWKPTTKLNKLLETGGLVNKSTPKPFFKYTALSNDFRYQTSTAPTTAKTQSTTLDSDEYYYEDDEEDEEEAIEKEKEQLDVLKQKPTPTPSVRPSTRSPKGYESFINSIPKKPTTKLQLVNNETSDDDDDEYYYDDDEDDDAIHSPPAIKSQFVPLSETMAPRPPTTPSYRNSSYHTHFPFLQHTTPSPDNVFNRNQQTATIPAFITFPKDIFQDIKPLNNIQRYLNHSTLRPYTKRTRLGSTSAPEFTTEFLFTTTTTTLPPTTTTTRTSTTTRKIYTIRPNRGQPRWKLQKSIDGTKNNKNLLEYDDKVGNRVEQSTQSPTVYIQQPSSRPIPQNNNRNYYNTTNSNAGYSNPSQFDSYYSVYDEDVELYRDIDYGQQYTTVTQKPIQSTYRPSTVSTQSPPRETYVKQEPVYEQRPVSSYNPDYDEALIAQLEGDSTYDHPPRNQLRTNSNTRNRGTSHFSTASGDDRPATVAVNRGTHPPRSRPTLKPSGTIVSKAQEFVDIYRNPPSRPEPLYPQPTPDKTAARCRKDVCLLPDCSCGGKEIPGDLNVESVPQIVLLTFDDSVNDLNKQLYTDLFEKGRVNPNGCPISATFYVSHEWTDYSQVQNLYSDGHEMASHTVSHSFGEQFSQKKWTREVAGQREILAAYGGVKLNDVRGMRAPFLSVGGNKMFKMLYDSNFTYDSSMPVYENRPPSWPYTLDYKIFHDCMIPPCPTKSYPGVWQVPMVMWQDLNGGRCSMGDACANPPESDGVMKMLMKNFDRHYSTNRAPFGLFYHAAWFTQPHHKEGFIKFLDTINAMNDVWIVTNWQALQWVRDPTPIERINQFQPFQCDYSDRPKRCNNPKVCNLWHKSGVRYMRTCQPCPEIYPWTGKTGIRSSRVDNDVDE